MRRTPSPGASREIDVLLYSANQHTAACHNHSASRLHLIQVLMRYLPKSPADRQAMLKAIGVRSVEDLFAPIPAEYRLQRDLKIPRQMAESEIVDFFRQRSQENG